MIKTVSFGLVHLAVAFGVGYALTGDVAIAGAISLLEPLANTVAFYFFDRYWGHPVWRRLVDSASTHFHSNRPPSGGVVPAEASS
jgi:uncharacterized membrane protein